MKKLIIGLIVTLAACSAPPQHKVAIEETAMDPAPVIAAPDIAVHCPTEQIVAHDGIGGTGCR